ncbi:MAG: ATP-binding protein [Thaumarchaeota archaeon]|nr:ATP-binding protein [Nitrososphaerota archaeon]
MTKESNSVFDDMGGKFEARLRDHRVVTRTTRMHEGDVTLSSSVAVLEVKFDFEVLDRLHEPSFVAIERPTHNGTSYLIYEVAALRPTHFQMLGMDVAMPTVIRKEYLNTIDGSWGRSDETWIDVAAVPMFHRMEADSGKEPRFTRARLVPLTGAKAHLLSKETVSKFLCVERGVEIGSMLGFNIPLTVDIESLVRYHTGVFGFTGAGKSNLTSFLIRQAMQKIPDLKVAVFDVAGEYAVHLLDVLSAEGRFFSTEDFHSDPVNLLNSQTLPETLETHLSEKELLKWTQRLFDEHRVEKVATVASDDAAKITLSYVVQLLQNTAESKGSGSIQAKIALQGLLQHFFSEKGYDSETDVRTLSSEDKEQLASIINELTQSIHGMSALRLDMTSLVNYVNSTPEQSPGNEETTPMTPEKLASFLLSPKSPRLNIIYTPNPDTARFAVSRFIDRLLFLKKTSGARRKLLIVLDEAQEFIPDRTVRSDYSDYSNKMVEALLRQGRKYRAHCWLSSQRLAHLNVNALQQLHSYFVSTLPRFYDRMVIADSFSLSYDILEKTNELETGQWLFVSYRATRQKNVPAFIQTPNNEEILLRNVSPS